MATLEDLLVLFEENMNTEQLDKVIERKKKILNFEETDKVSIRINYGISGFDWKPYQEVYENFEAMMYNELRSGIVVTHHSKGMLDDTLPMLRANYGVGIMPSLFGLNCRIVNGNMPWVDHLESLEDIKALIEKGVPDVHHGLGGRIFETHEFFNEKLAKYPKCRQYIPVYHPDLQGPFDVAHLIWGPDIYYALYDEGELVHQLMEVVTDTYIHFMKEIKKGINDEIDGHCFHWGDLYKGSLVLRNDSAINLSKEMYEEFVKPYDEKILKAFGKGSIHYCGQGKQWIESMLQSEGMSAINFGQPPNMVFGTEFLDYVYEMAKQHKVPIIGYGMDKQHMKDIHNSRYTTGVTYFTGVDTLEDAKRMLGL